MKRETQSPRGKLSSWAEEAKQMESHTDHQYQCPGHYSLRSSGGGWTLRFLGLQRSVPEKGLGLAVWRQPEGAVDQCTYSQGSMGGDLGPQEKEGESRRGGTTKGTSFFAYVQATRQD